MPLTDYTQPASQYRQPRAYLADILQSDRKKAVSVATGLFSGRRSKGAVASSEYYFGNHWQRADGYIGAKPLNDGLTLKQIELAFVSENVIKEVVDRHVGGILGREPLWGFVPQETVSRSTLTRRRRFAKLVGSVINVITGGQSEDALAQEADEALTTWWDSDVVKPKHKLKDALVKCLTEDRALFRLFIPRGLYDSKQLIPVQPSLTDALKLLHVETVCSDQGGIFIDSDTRQRFALYVYEIDGSKCVELSYVNEAGQTILQILSEKAELVVEPVAYDLQGHLWMHEIHRPALITEQIRSAQKSLNLALTMLMRNVNLAGNLERTIMNAERPKRKVRVTDNSAQGYHEELIDSEWLTGPGVSNLLTGLLIRNDKGEIIDRANPNISYRDPVPIDTFVGTRNQYRECILGQAQQSHMLISGDATVSGRSREQARAEYRGSLLDSKDPLDGAGRWLLEGGLRIAAVLCGRVAEFATLRCDFESRVEEGPITPEERAANREDVKAGLLDKETAMSRGGVEDTDAAKERIAEDRAESAKLNPQLVPPSPPTKPNGDSKVLQ